MRGACGKRSDTAESLHESFIKSSTGCSPDRLRRCRSSRRFLVTGMRYHMDGVATRTSQKRWQTDIRGAQFATGRWHSASVSSNGPLSVAIFGAGRDWMKISTRSSTGRHSIRLSARGRTACVDRLTVTVVQSEQTFCGSFNHHHILISQTVTSQLSFSMLLQREAPCCGKCTKITVAKS